MPSPPKIYQPFSYTIFSFARVSACHGKRSKDLNRVSACHGKRSNDSALASACHGKSSNDSDFLEEKVIDDEL